MKNKENCNLNISLDQLKKFLYLEENRNEPKESYAILYSNYNGYIDQNSILIEAEINVKIYSDLYKSIDIVQSDAIVIESKCDKEGGDIGFYKDRYKFIAKGAGVYKIFLKFYLPFRSKDRKNSFNLYPVGSGTFKFTIDQNPFDTECYVSNALGYKIVPDEKTVIEGAISPKEITVGWSKVVKVEKKEEKKEVKPIVYGDLKTKISIDEELMRCSSKIDYQIYQAGVISFKIEVLDGKVISVTGNGIKNYDVDHKDNNSYVIIFLEYETDSKFSCTIHYEKSLDSEKDKFLIPVVKLQDCNRESGYIAILSKSNIELNVEEQKKLTVIDPQEYPSGHNVDEAVFTYKYLASPYELDLVIKRHDEIPVLVAIAERGIFSTAILTEGKQITKVKLKVRNNNKAFIDVTLPKDSVCLSSFVQKKPVKPIKNEEGVMMIPIPRSKESENVFDVEFVWIEGKKKWDKKGNIEIDMGNFEIPISHFFWKIYLPENYKYSDFKGNVKRAEGFVDLFESDNQYDKFYQEPSAPAGEYYDDFNSGVDMPQEMSAIMDSEMEEDDDYFEFDQMDDMMKEEAPMMEKSKGDYPKMQQSNIMPTSAMIQQVKKIEGEMTGGALPVKVEFPATGDEYYFERIFLHQESAKLNFKFKKKWKLFGKKEVEQLDDDDK